MVWPPKSDQLEVLRRHWLGWGRVWFDRQLSSQGTLNKLCWLFWEEWTAWCTMYDVMSRPDAWGLHWGAVGVCWRTGFCSPWFSPNKNCATILSWWNAVIPHKDRFSLDLYISAKVWFYASILDSVYHDYCLVINWLIKLTFKSNMPIKGFFWNF